MVNYRLPDKKFTSFREIAYGGKTFITGHKAYPEHRDSSLVGMKAGEGDSHGKGLFLCLNPPPMTKHGAVGRFFRKLLRGSAEKPGQSFLAREPTIAERALGEEAIRAGLQNQLSVFIEADKAGAGNPRETYSFFFGTRQYKPPPNEILRHLVEK